MSRAHARRLTIQSVASRRATRRDELGGRGRGVGRTLNDDIGFRYCFLFPCFQKKEKNMKKSFLNGTTPPDGSAAALRRRVLPFARTSVVPLTSASREAPQTIVCALGICGVYRSVRERVIRRFESFCSLVFHTRHRSTNVIRVLVGYKY